MNMSKVLFLFLHGFCIGMMGCHTPPPGTPSLPSRAISCTTEVVARDWARVYPAVQMCLSAVMTMPMTCLDALPATAGVALDVVACIVRTSGQEAASQQGKGNADDVVTIRKAERANAWIDTRHLEFE